MTNAAEGEGRRQRRPLPSGPSRFLSPGARRGRAVPKRRSAGTSAGSLRETHTQARRRLRTSACWPRPPPVAVADAKGPCSSWLRSASLNGRPQERRIRLSSPAAVFFLGQKSASDRVPVRLSPTRLRDKAPTRTTVTAEAALPRFDAAYPVVSASATFTPQRPPYHKEWTDLFPGRIFSSVALSKEDYP